MHSKTRDMTTACWNKADDDVQDCLMAYAPGSDAFADCFYRAMAAQDTCIAQTHVKNSAILNESLMKEHDDLTRVPWWSFM